MVSVNKPSARNTQARTRTRDYQTLGSTGRAREGRDNVQQVERTLAQYVREQPFTSILIAAGIGLVLGRFWMRR